MGTGYRYEHSLQVTYTLEMLAKTLEQMLFSPVRTTTHLNGLLKTQVEN